MAVARLISLTDRSGHRTPAAGLLRTVVAASAVLAFGAGCSTHTHDKNSAPTPAPPLARATVPAGFQPRPDGTLAAVRPLTAVPARHVTAAQVRPAALPSAASSASVAAVLTVPVPVLVRPLLISTPDLRPGAMVTIAAAGLPTQPHDALIVLTGPSGRWERLVGVSAGVAAARVTIPDQVGRGSWQLAITDVSDVHYSTSRRATGVAYAYLAPFVIR